MSRYSPSRRAFLRGAGATLALPLLESLAFRKGARAQSPAPPRRLLVFFVPNGLRMDEWAPATTGADYALTPLLEPLADFKKDMLVVSGIGNQPAENNGRGGDHATGTASSLTAMRIARTDGENIRNGISMDQVAARAFSGLTPFSSLQLGINGKMTVGECDAGLSCAYSSSISWAAAATPLPKLVDPGVIFDLLFGGVPAGQDPARRWRRKKSMLDFVLGDATRLRARLGAADQAKLDEHLDGVREVETRIQWYQKTLSSKACEPGPRPPSSASGLDLPTETRLLCDLMALVFKCDLTRVITFMLGDGRSNLLFDFLGVEGPHHYNSHHMNEPGKLAALHTINVWEMQQLAYLLGALKAIDEGGASVLDSSAVLLVSDISDGDSHSHYQLPTLIVGRAGGALHPGRHVVYPDSTPLANVHLTLLQALGVPVTSFGQDGAAPLDQLTSAA